MSKSVQSIWDAILSGIALMPTLRPLTLSRPRNIGESHLHIKKRFRNTRVTMNDVEDVAYRRNESEKQRAVERWAERWNFVWFSRKPQSNTIQAYCPKADRLLLSPQAHCWFPLNQNWKRKWLTSVQAQFALYSLFFLLIWIMPSVSHVFKKMEVRNICFIQFCRRWMAR